MNRSRTLGAFGTLALATSVLAACSTSSGTSSSAAAGGGGSANSNATCPLVGAPDPGNSAAPANVASASGAPKLTQKSTYKVAFSQNASNNPWRLAETKSFRDEAAKRGWDLTVTDANNDQATQIQQIRTLIGQKPDALFIAPITEQLGNVVAEAGKAGIPVFLVDRDVDHAVAKPGQDFVSVMTSDFIQEGKRAAWAMANATNGTAKIIELEGTTGSSPAIDRKKGFDEAIKACPGLQVVVSQDGDFNRDKGRQVMDTLIQSHPEATAVYAHNDEMAIGAIAALKARGKQPGKNIKLVSIDGEKDGLQAIINGELHTAVECSPRFGPKAFDVMTQYASGQATPVAFINSDRLFNSSNAQQLVSTAF